MSSDSPGRAALVRQAYRVGGKRLIPEINPTEKKLTRPISQVRAVAQHKVHRGVDDEKETL
jgi:hypothetical protein